jgi:hypothetical protein
MTMKPTVILTAALLCVLSPVCFAAEAAPSPAPQKMPWEDPSYAKDISATQADSRAEERAKGGWTEFIRHHEDRKKWVTEKKVDILMIGDSIVFGWSREGHEVWNEHYGNRNAVNIGSSGDMTSHMLWHMPDALHPNAEGYREWAKAMEPMLTTLLGK